MSGFAPIPNGEQEVDQLGIALSRHIPCPVRLSPYSNHAKPVFECQCLKTFPLFAVKGAVKSGDWSFITAKHLN